MSRRSERPVSPSPVRSPSSPSSCWSARRELAVVAGRRDEAGRAVRDQPARRGADRVGGDHRRACQHRLVADEAPRLQEAAGGDRRHDHRGGGGVGDRQLLARDVAERSATRRARRARRAAGPRRPGTASRPAQPAAARREQHLDALLLHEAPDEQHHRHRRREPGRARATRHARRRSRRARTAPARRPAARRRRCARYGGAGSRSGTTCGP